MGTRIGMRHRGRLAIACRAARTWCSCDNAIGRMIASAMQPVDITNSTASISNMHTPVDTCIDVLDMIVYMAFDYDDTLLNTARHIISA